MSQYNYFRRTSIDKFSNRPPFDVKKMDDATSTENRVQNASLCNHCEKRYVNSPQKSYISVVKYLEQFGGKYQTNINNNNNNRNIIPKIIESFQRVTPKRSLKKIKCKKQSESLETLFRNSDSKFGKNLPNHRLMKDLLKNLDGGNPDIQTPSSIQQVDMIPIKDLNSNPLAITVKTRVDKNTSTTGLQWPVLPTGARTSKTDAGHSNTYLTKSNSGKFKSKIPQRNDSLPNNNCKHRNCKQLKNNVETKKSSGSSDLEYFPTKENRFKKMEPVSKIPKQVFQTNNASKLVRDSESMRCKHNDNDGDFIEEYSNYVELPSNNEQRKKEKSFVQLQVEKLNKRNKSNQFKAGAVPPNNARMKNIHDSNKRNANYISLMTSVKETLPKMAKMERNSPRGNTSECHDWSDNQMRADAQVRFPKETRVAMENLIKNLKRVPLAKYVKNQDLNVQPAIRSNSALSPDYVECENTYPGTCNRNKPSHLPRSRGMVHHRSGCGGPCARPDTVPPPRYSERRSQSKGFVKY